MWAHGAGGWTLLEAHAQPPSSRRTIQRKSTAHTLRGCSPSPAARDAASEKSPTRGRGVFGTTPGAAPRPGEAAPDAALRHQGPRCLLRLPKSTGGEMYAMQEETPSGASPPRALSQGPKPPVLRSSAVVSPSNSGRDEGRRLVVDLAMLRREVLSLPEPDPENLRRARAGAALLSALMQESSDFGPAAPGVPSGAPWPTSSWPLRTRPWTPPTRSWSGPRRSRPGRARPSLRQAL